MIQNAVSSLSAVLPLGWGRIGYCSICPQQCKSWLKQHTGKAVSSYLGLGVSEQLPFRARCVQIDAKFAVLRSRYQNETTYWSSVFPAACSRIAIISLNLCRVTTQTSLATKQTRTTNTFLSWSCSEIGRAHV